MVAGEDEAGAVKVEVDEEVSAVASGDVVAVDFVAVAGVVEAEVAKAEVEVDTTPTTSELRCATL